MDAWEAEQHQMMVDDTMRYCNKFLLEDQQDSLEEQREMTYTSLVLCGKIQSAIRWIMVREQGIVYQP